MHEDDADALDDEARNSEREEWAASAAMGPSACGGGQRAGAARSGRVRFAPEPATTEAASQLSVSSPVAPAEARPPPVQVWPVQHPTVEGGGQVVAAWAWAQLREQQTSPLTTTLAIILEAPVANTRDTVHFLEGKPGERKRGSKRTPRRRPPSWKRRLAAAASAFPMKISAGSGDLHYVAHIWVDVEIMISCQSIVLIPIIGRPFGGICVSEVAKASAEGRHQLILHVFPGVLGLISLLYKLPIQDHHVTSGIFGPLWIFEPARVGLLLSYLAGRKPWLGLPGWKRADLTYMLYIPQVWHPPAVRKWQEDATTAVQDKELRALGEALAAIMQSQFKEAITAAVLPTPAFPVQLPCPGDVTRDAFAGAPALDAQGTIPFIAPQPDQLSLMLFTMGHRRAWARRGVQQRGSQLVH
jgi:hypothetical protein